MRKSPNLYYDWNRDPVPVGRLVTPLIFSLDRVIGLQITRCHGSMASSFSTTISESLRAILPLSLHNFVFALLVPEYIKPPEKFVTCTVNSGALYDSTRFRLQSALYPAHSAK